MIWLNLFEETHEYPSFQIRIFYPSVLKFNGKHLASVFREDKKLLNLFVQIEARTSKGFKDKRRKACTAVVLGI